MGRIAPDLSRAVAGPQIGANSNTGIRKSFD
jgi:hypothetical protein